MAECNVQELMEEAKCFMCLSPGQMQMVKLQLLCDALGGNVWYTDAGGSEDNPIDADPDVPI